MLTQRFRRAKGLAAGVTGIGLTWTTRRRMLLTIVFVEFFSGIE